jgi:hypothetical protein
MSSWRRPLIPVFTLATMAMSSVASSLSAEAPVVPHLAEPVVLNEKDARDHSLSSVYPEYPPVA